MTDSPSTIQGYRLEWKPGEYVHMSPEYYAKEVCRDGARTWGLYAEPQPGCSAEVAVYRGRYWIQPKYVYNTDLKDFTPLYLGPVLHEPPMDEAVLLAFPSIIEERLRTNRPDLVEGTDNGR